MAMFIPMQFYRLNLFGLNLSVDRTLIIILVPSIFLHYYKSRFRIRRYTYYIFVWLTIIAINTLLFQSQNGRFLTNDLPMYLICSLVLIFSSSVSNYNFNNIFDVVIKVHALIIIFFGFNALYQIWFLQELTFRPPFMSDSSYQDWINQERNHIMTLMAQKRLTFPFATSPHLSFVSGFILFYGLFKLYLGKNKFWFLTLPLLTIILIGALSRSGLLAFLISIVMAYAFKKRDNEHQYNSKPLLIMICFFLFLIPSIILSVSQLLDQTNLTRIINFDITKVSLSGHYDVRVNLLQLMFNSDLITFFFGHGIGGTKVFLELSSAHMSFLTIFYETGLLGLISFTALWTVPIYKALSIKKFGYAHYKIFVVSGGVFLVFCHIFYNATTFVPLWLYLGWIINFQNINNKYNSLPKINYNAL